MRVLYLTPGCFDKGGISRYSRYQIEALRVVHGVEAVRVLSLMGRDDHSLEGDFDVDWQGLPGSVSRLSRLRFSLRAMREVLTWRPRVIHVAHVNLTPLQSLLARLVGATTVLNVYGLELWGGLSARRRRALFGVDHVIADCHSTADHVARERLWRQRPEVIWDCADLDRFCPGESDSSLMKQFGLAADSSPTVMFLGRLSKSARHKGVERLISEFNTVHNSVESARLLIVGDGDDRTRLEDVASRTAASGRIHFLGRVNEEHLPAIYRAATIFVLVSEKGHAMGEGIPLTPIEALASGIPIIVGDEDGSREAVDSGRNGWVISPRAAGKLAQIILAAFEMSTDEWMQVRASARLIAEERFGFPAFVEKHRLLYESIS